VLGIVGIVNGRVQHQWRGRKGVCVIQSGGKPRPAAPGKKLMGSHFLERSSAFITRLIKKTGVAMEKEEARWRFIPEQSIGLR